MTAYGLNEWFWAMSEPTPTWPNLNFGKYSCKFEQMMIRYDFLCAKWVILSMFELTPTWPYCPFVNFSYELGQWPNMTS